MADMAAESDTEKAHLNPHRFYDENNPGLKLVLIGGKSFRNARFSDHQHCVFNKSDM
jgi:hypothetical protein